MASDGQAEGPPGPARETDGAAPGPVPETRETPPRLPSRRRRILLPATLFLVTVATTFWAQGAVVLMYNRWPPRMPFVVYDWENGLVYAAAVMTILTAHELGHFFVALRHRVPVSLPFFIPMPIGPIGTMGAVIGMRAHVGDRRAVFDIGIAGPLAGLVPALACCVWGLKTARYFDISNGAAGQAFGDPLLLRWLAEWILGPRPPGHDVLLNPILFAGWVGIFITALNLLPIGQLDGGHILYTLLRKKAYPIAVMALMGCLVGMIAIQYWGWSLMVFLLFLMGPRHPPTADDNVPLGWGRTVLGWLTLAFLPIGFTPTPFLF